MSKSNSKTFIQTSRPQRKHRNVDNIQLFHFGLPYNFLLTAWSRVLLEKLTGFAANQEIPRAFYGTTRKFITVLTSARHLSISWANSIQSPQPLSTSWRSILILSSHLRLGLPSGLFPSGFPNQNLVHTSPFLHTCHIRRPSHSSRVYHPHNIGWGVQIIGLLNVFLRKCRETPAVHYGFMSTVEQPRRHNISAENIYIWRNAGGDVLLARLSRALATLFNYFETAFSDMRLGGGIRKVLLAPQGIGAHKVNH